MSIGRTEMSCLFPILDRKSTRLNSSHVAISYAVFCLKKKKVHLLLWMINVIPDRLLTAGVVLWMMWLTRMSVRMHDALPLRSRGTAVDALLLIHHSQM